LLVSRVRDDRIASVSRVLVLRGGRVVDPESGRDEVTDVVVGDDRIVSVGSAAGVDASEIIDATGLVVGPG